MASREMVEVTIVNGIAKDLRTRMFDGKSGTFRKFTDNVLVVELHKHTLLTAVIYLAKQTLLTELPDEGNIFEFIKPSEGL